MSADLAAIVASLKYKPGWEFHLTQGPTMSFGRADLVLAGSTLGVSASCGWLAAVPASMPLYVHATLRTPDSGDPEKKISVTHTFAVPPMAREIVAWDWERWLFEGVIMAIERHEAGEFFEVADFKPYYPEHGPGADPYVLKRRERQASGNG